MLDYTISIILKIFSLTLFLFSAMIWKKILKEGDRNYHYIFYRVIATVMVLLPVPMVLTYFWPSNTAFTYTVPKEVCLTDWLIAIAIGLFSFWGLYFYTKAMQSGRFSFVGPLSTIAFVFTLCTSLLLYHESLTVTKTIVLLLTIGGLLFHQKKQVIQLKFSREVVFVFLCNLFWGISFVLYLIPIKKLGTFTFSLVLEGCVFISCLGLLLFHEKRIIPSSMTLQKLGWCLLMGIFVAFGSLLGNFSLTQFSVALNILLGSVFEIITIAIGLFYYKERLSKHDWILLVLASIGGFLMVV